LDHFSGFNNRETTIIATAAIAINTRCAQDSCDIPRTGGEKQARCFYRCVKRSKARKTSMRSKRQQTASRFP